MEIRTAIIGGSGIGSRLLALPGRTLRAPTAFGWISGRLISLAGSEVLVVSRHGTTHGTPPHKVNYRALATGLKQLGVTACFSTAAVGSLTTELPVGSLAICSDLIDASARNITLYDAVVKHTDMSGVFSPVLRETLRSSADDLTISVQDSATYLGVNGPRYETPAEINAFRSWGADVVGMTVSSEAIAMRESGVPYACLAIVTNLAAGMTEGTLEHFEVVNVMDQVGDSVVQLLTRAVQLTEAVGSSS